MASVHLNFGSLNDVLCELTSFSFSVLRNKCFNVWRSKIPICLRDQITTIRRYVYKTCDLLAIEGK